MTSFADSLNQVSLTVPFVLDTHAKTMWKERNLESVKKDTLGAVDYKIHQIDAMIDLRKNQVKELQNLKKYWAGIYRKLQKLTEKPQP